MSGGRRSELLDRALRTTNVEILDFTPEMRTLVASAAGVVSMAGYNTVVEELVADVPALLVPRCSPRREQDIRAQRVAPRSRLERVEVEQFDADVIAAFVARLHQDAGRPGHAIDLGGARTVASLLNDPATNPTTCRPEEPFHV